MKVMEEWNTAGNGIKSYQHLVGLSSSKQLSDSMKGSYQNMNDLK